MIPGKTYSIAVLCVCAAAANGSAQINFAASNINFRTASTNTKQTLHYGGIKIMGATDVSPRAITEIIDQTPSTSAATLRYGIRSTSRIKDGIGTGGYFEGGRYGVEGSAIKATSGGYSLYGGSFLATNTSSNASISSYTYGMYGSAYTNNTGAISYGVYGTTSGTVGTAYAGYFNGNLSYTGNLTKVSDENLKENIEPMPGCLDKISQLKPVKYDYQKTKHKNFRLPEGKQLGLLAQDVEEVFPEIVHVDIAPVDQDNDEAGNSRSSRGDRTPPETYKSVDYISLIPVLVKAIQEQQAEIDLLKAEVSRGYK